MLTLHLLQNCLVYVNTLMLQAVLAEPTWLARSRDTSQGGQLGPNLLAADLGIAGGDPEHKQLPLVLDASTPGQRFTILAVCVVIRGCAIPVAWYIVPATQHGAWMPHILALIDQLVPEVPRDWQAFVCVDRGLWSPRLWHHLQQRRLHPLLRIANGVPVRLAKRKRTVTPAHLVPCPGRAWIGAAAVFGEQARQTGTLVIVWGHGHAERWVLLTDLAPRQVEQSWYGLRM
jgi:hypothetical protein